MCDSLSRRYRGRLPSSEANPFRFRTFMKVLTGSAATAVASASVGADAHPDAADAGDERGLSLEEKAVQRAGASTENGG